MDFTHTAYFGGSQPYPFMGIPPPLTPAHSTSVASDDYNTTSPPEVYEQFPNGLPHDQFQNFDNYAVQFNAAQAFPPGPPTPPGQVPVTAPAPAPAPAPVQQQQPGPINGAVPRARPPIVEIPPLSRIDFEEQNRRHAGGSNSEEDDLTPAQSRRKAQNRAAQRAFRERKERHVKDLETRLQQTEQREQETASENERLKKELAQRNTELEILRATSNAGGSPANSASPVVTGPMSYNPTDFYSNVLQNHANKTPSHRIVTSDNGERLLAAGATWELIINHELFRRGLVDVGVVSERIKPLAKCDGQGPVFEESAILMAIEQSVASGSDELI